jgi:hypothetical protein
VSEKVKKLCKEEACFRLSFRLHAPLILLLLPYRKHIKRGDRSKPEVDGMSDTTICRKEIFFEKLQADDIHSPNTARKNIK